MKGQLPNKFHIYFRKDNEPAQYWSDKLSAYLKTKNSGIKADPASPEVLFILGGDGTILEAVKKYHHKSNPLILGFNLGTVGFLASVREPRDFILALGKFLKNKFTVVERMLLSVSIERRGENIFSSEALNEVVIQNPLGMVDLEVQANGTVIKKLRGSGIMVATATGSTAYNLSAHGPIVMPEIKCMVVTEIMTHDVPSPSIVFDQKQEIKFKIKGFRKPDILLITDGGKPAVLKEHDIITVKSSPHPVRFIEFEKNYFFKSLKEKFSIK